MPNHTTGTTQHCCVFIHGMFGWGRRSPLFNTLPNYWPQDLLEELNLGKNVIVEVGVGSSDHDRACETFYQLIGGTVDYGLEHSRVNAHARFGATYPKGELTEWSAAHPIHLVGHSYGATTAIELYQLVSLDYFGLGTSSDWIISITGIAGPLSGSTLVHSLGVRPEDLSVRLTSVGYLFGLTAVLYWKLCRYVPSLTSVYDYRMPQWLEVTSSWRELLAFNRHPFHTSQDNAFVSLSPLVRMKKNATLRFMEQVFLVNVVSDLHLSVESGRGSGQELVVDSHKNKNCPDLDEITRTTTRPPPPMTLFSRVIRWLSKLVEYDCHSVLPRLHHSFNVQEWMQNDGIVNTHSMLYPRLAPDHAPTEDEHQVLGLEHFDSSRRFPLRKGQWSILHGKEKNHACGTAGDETSRELYGTIFKVLKQVEEEEEEEVEVF